MSINIRKEIIYRIACVQRGRTMKSPSFKHDRHLIIESMLKAFELMGYIRNMHYDRYTDIWMWTENENGDEVSISMHDVF